LISFSIRYHQAERVLGNNYNVAASQNNVLLKIFAILDVTEAERIGLQVLTHTAHDFYLVDRGKGCHAPRHGNGLDHINVAVGDLFTRSCHLAHHVDLVATQLLHGNRYHRVRNVLREALGNGCTQLFNRFAGGLDITHQRE